MKKLFDRLARVLLTASGFTTSVVILLIIAFLFTEGAGLFSERVVSEGYVLAMNERNPVSELTAAQIKDVFDGEVTNWQELGGNDMPIHPFRLEHLNRYYSDEELGTDYEQAGTLIAGLIRTDEGMLAYVPETLLSGEPGLHFAENSRISLADVFGGTEWFPTAVPSPLFGIVPLLLGTLWVSLFAILFALPFGLAVSIYLAEVASWRVRNMLKPVIELLGGIPSVVYGFFGLVVVVPFLQQVLGLPVGESGLAGALVLALMALPTIITVSEDALRACPRSMREASLALGATQWQTIRKVVVPCAKSGIMSGVVLGVGRAVGETMAVLMVTGNAAVIPISLLDPLRTIPATIAAELGEAPAGGAHYEALFVLGVALFFITFLINTSMELVAGQNRHRMR